MKLKTITTKIMKVEILMNGTTKIVLIPENDIEIAILANIAKGDVEATLITQHTQILDKIILDGLVVMPRVERKEGIKVIEVED
jgi:hypothetical protein